MKSKSVAVAFSGGKDSTAAILLLRDAGHSVEAVTLQLGLEKEKKRLEACVELCARIGVPHRIVDARQAFQRRVIDFFNAEYAAGRTPNPCVVCNTHIKFSLLMDKALEGRFSWFATGHYARLERSDRGNFLVDPIEQSKSQIYFLAMVDPARMSRVCFPLARTRLRDVRRITSGLPLAGGGESQDVCFLGGRPLEDYLREKIPQAFRHGPILDPLGNEIGKHGGMAAVTMGQRRGLGHSGGRRLYVVDRDPESNTVVLGEAGDLEREELLITRPVYWCPITVGEVVDVQIRYGPPVTRATVLTVSLESLRVRFHTPVRAVTAGQAGVCASEGRVVAAGIIADEGAGIRRG